MKFNTGKEAAAFVSSWGHYVTKRGNCYEVIWVSGTHQSLSEQEIRETAEQIYEAECA